MSIKTIFIARASDGLLLCESYDSTTDSQTEILKKNGRELIKRLSNPIYATSEEKVMSTVDTQGHKFHYQVEDGVIYLSLTEEKYP